MLDGSLFAIYGLYDPRDSSLRYIGQTTVSIEARLKSHLHAAKCGKKQYPVYKWIRQLISLGLKPSIKGLETFAWSSDVGKRLNDAEVKWIAEHQHVGRLLNIAPGGDILYKEQSLKRRERRKNKAIKARRKKLIKALIYDSSSRYPCLSSPSGSTILVPRKPR